MSEDYLYKPKMNYISYSRKGKVEEQYNCHIRKLKRNNINIEEYIMKTIIKDNFFIITKNLFPYNIDYIDHYLLWINPSYKISYKTLYEYINLKFQGKSFYYFENYIANKSILGIQHYHIFVNKNQLKKNINYLF